MLSCLKVIGTANIFSPFSFLKSCAPPSPPHTPFIFAALSHSFCCSIPLSILQFRRKDRYYAGGNGLWERKERNKNVAWQSSCLVKIRSKTISGGNAGICATAQAGSESCEASGSEDVGSSLAFFTPPPRTVKPYLVVFESTGLCWKQNQA